MTTDSSSPAREPAMIKGIKGVKDILPDQIDRWLLIENSARRYARLYGFREIRLPIFEVTELFARSIGATTDIVEKEMYTFTDRDGTSLTLRPEGTAGAVRSYIEHNLGASPVPQKLFYLGPMFRHERPQAGRLRQFHQFGVEFLGVAAPEADVEVLSLLWRFFHALRLPGLTLELNTLGETEDRPRYKKVLRDFLETKKSALCANCQRRLETNPLRVLDCKVPGCREATADAPSIIDHISPWARDHFEAVEAGLSAINIPFSLNPRLVRGLDYYTLTTFEVTCTHLGAQNAVGAGGRYDGLVEVLGGAPTPAIGFAVGLERIALLLPEDAIAQPTPSVYVAGFGCDGARTAYPLLDSLRQAGVEATCDYRSATLKAHLRQADRLHCSHTLIIGDDEVTKGMAILRNMVSKVQEQIPLSSLVRDVAARLLNV
ncbi:MAG TPA: histidine--tRNA ligase [Nitrospiraceae bacterium]|nr:histidine--tRNA ligase [Nitrospiraceae bacterium]